MDVTKATYAGATALALVCVSALGFALTRDDGAGADGRAAAASASPTSTSPVVQLGAPGQPNSTLSPGAQPSASVAHAAADVDFMTGMVAHHEQALRMTELARSNTGNADLELLAERMDVSQKDEIRQMEDWLKQYAARGHTGGHGSTHDMPGMLTDADFAKLRAARDAEFDELFLQYMIRHHEGAITMVESLLAGEGGQASDVFMLAQHMASDQALEIARMKEMLAG